MFPMIRRVIMRCNCDGEIYEDGDGPLAMFETKAILFKGFGFYLAFPYGEIVHADNRADWGLK